MNKERALLIVAAILGAYLLGYYRVISVPSVPSMSGVAEPAGPKASSALAKPAQAQGQTVTPTYSPRNAAATADVQPTPWPAPEGWQR